MFTQEIKENFGYAKLHIKIELGVGTLGLKSICEKNC